MLECFIAIGNSEANIAKTWVLKLTSWVLSHNIDTEENIKTSYRVIKRHQCNCFVGNLCYFNTGVNFDSFLVSLSEKTPMV